MTIESFRAFCLSLPHTNEDLKWDEVLCFCVVDKIFALYNLETHNICFKITPEDFEILIERNGFAQAPHFRKKQWISMESFQIASDKEIQQWIQNAFHLIVQKLPKKTQEKILS